MAVYKRGERWHYAAMKVNALSIQTDAHKKLRAAIAKATGRVVADDAAPECTCAAKDMTFGRCCKLTPNKCKWCGHDIHAHDKQYGCAEDGCDCETPNAKGQRGAACGASAAPTGCASNGNHNERTEK